MWLLLCLSIKIVACELYSTDYIIPNYELNTNHKEVWPRDNYQKDQDIPEQFVSKNQSFDGLFHKYNKTVIKIMKNKVLRNLLIENKTTSKNAQLTAEKRIQKTAKSVTQPKFKIMLPVNKSDELVSVKRVRRWNDRHYRRKHRKKHYIVKHKRKGAQQTSKDENTESPNITAPEIPIIQESDVKKHPLLNMATNFCNKTGKISQQTIKKTIRRLEYIDKPVAIVTSLPPETTATTPVPITSTTKGSDKMISPWFTYPQQLFVLEKNVQSKNRNMKENERFISRQGESESSDSESEYNEFGNQLSYPSESVTTRNKKSNTIDKSLKSSILIKALQLIKASLDSYQAYANYLAYKFRTYTPETFKIVEHQINDVLYRADTEKLEGDKTYRTTSIDYIDKPVFFLPTRGLHEGPPPPTYKMKTQTGGPPPPRHTVTGTAQRTIDEYDFNNDFDEFDADMY